MRFIETPVAGVWLIEAQLIEDERGFFARTFGREEFLARGLTPPIEFSALSFNHTRGTLRGLHLQLAPYQEAKLVRCTQGAIYDVALDLRAGSPSFKGWFGIELSAQNHRMLYLPEGCAHGFQSLLDQSEVFYQLSSLYHAPSVAGVRWNDPVFNITWPLPVSCIAARDRDCPNFHAEHFNGL